MTRAEELLADAERLAASITAYSAPAMQGAGHADPAEAIALIDIAIGKLRRLAAGRSDLPEPNVYLSVSSLNKGLIEVGGAWRGDERLVALAAALTAKAYRFYKETRSPLR